MQTKDHVSRISFLAGASGPFCVCVTCDSLIPFEAGPVFGHSAGWEIELSLNFQFSLSTKYFWP
jgi:hypothetical protein